MINISGKFPKDQMINDLRNMQKQVEFANVVALTRTAQDVQKAEEQQVDEVFDRPTRYTKNAFYLKPATKQKPEARVWIKSDTFKGTPAENYLRPHIDGGSRKQKRFERAMVAAGLMPSGYFVVPGEACPLDAYGNVPARFIVQMLSYFKAFGEQGYKANMTDKGRDRFNKKASRAVGQLTSYFAIGLGQKLKPGIYQRVAFARGSAVRPVFVFVKSVGYERRFKFYETSEQVIEKRFKPNMDASLEAAMASKR
jgi:ABC-type oligopeptide transport system ATPase subunit